ncbi:hypothetical protein NMY22_g7456 [Coprinellus aureogranulatus]|nr:hypothetical protein NMY22_g7456 [Coprinellus aureogranulatus]
MTRTVTVTQVLHGEARQRPRSLSVSLVGREVPPVPPSKLQGLPSELIVSILEMALLSTRPLVLATISRTIHLHLNEVLYRTIILSSPQSIRAVRWTALTSPQLLLLVKKLVVTCDSLHIGGERVSLDPDLRDIVRACKNLHTLTLPGSAPLPLLTDHDHIEEITFSSFVDNHTRQDSPVGSAAVKRLRFTEPSECGWVSPCEMLSALGNPEGLTHLQLSRKAGANEVNDIAFRDAIVEVLAGQVKLKVLVVSIFKGYSWESDEPEMEESHMWRIMEELREMDRRISIRVGKRDDWRKEDEAFQPGRDINSRFWAQF